MSVQDLEGYVAECERRIKKLESRVAHLEDKLAATIAIATRQATEDVIDRLQEALRDAD